MPTSASSSLPESPRSAGPLEALRARVLRAGGWTLAGFALGQAIRFGGNLVMTRLLVPEMFGVMAIATMVMYGLALFSDLGLRQSIVQSRRGGEAAFLNTAWAVQIARGFVIWGAALAVSIASGLPIPVFPVGSVYADPSLPYVIAILSLCSVIAGFESTRLSEASRSLTLGRITQIDLAAQMAGLLCMLAWAAIDRSIWALVAGGLCAAAGENAAQPRLAAGQRQPLAVGERGRAGNHRPGQVDLRRLDPRLFREQRRSPGARRPRERNRARRVRDRLPDLQRGRAGARADRRRSVVSRAERSRARSAPPSCARPTTSSTSRSGCPPASRPAC